MGKLTCLLAFLLACVVACGAVAQSTIPDGWHKSQKHSGYWYYQYKGWPVAYYDPDRNKFEVMDAKTFRWVEAVPPWTGLAALPWAAPAVENFGVDRGELAGVEKWSINGRQVTREDWYTAVADAGPPISDDSGKWRLTCVRDPRRVTDESWAKLLKDLADRPELAELRGKVHLQAYSDPSHWHLAGFKLGQDQRFVTSGLGIYLQEPATADRKTSPVVQARYAYEGAEALRRIDPGYDPNKVPGSEPSRNPLAGLKLDGRTLMLLGIAGLVLYLFLAGKGKATPAPPQGSGAADSRMVAIYDAFKAEAEREAAAKKEEDARRKKAIEVADFARRLREAADPKNNPA